MAKPHTQKFIDYFDRKFWGNADGSSGPNSAYDLTHELRQALEKLFQQYKIKSIVDAGCGDANLFRFMEIGSIEYLGLECVPKLTKQNRKRFKAFPNMHFDTADVVSDPIPKADLVMCRDVVHYLPNDLILLLLENIKKSGSKYLLITHNRFAPQSANVAIEVGIFRPVNLCQAPFNWPEPIEMIVEDDFGKSLGLWILEP